MAAITVTIASSRPSGTGLPSLSVTALVYMCMPTFRTSSSERPGSVSSPPPLAAVQLRSGFSFRTKDSPDFSMLLVRSPRMSPAQLE